MNGVPFLHLTVLDDYETPRHLFLQISEVTMKEVRNQTGYTIDDDAETRLPGFLLSVTERNVEYYNKRMSVLVLNINWRRITLWGEV